MLSTYTLIYTSPNAKPRAARCNTVATSPPRSISLAYQCMRLSTAKQCRTVLDITNKPKRLASGGHITQQFATLVPKREWVNSPGWTTTASVGTRYLFHMWDLLIRICSCWARLAQEKDAAAHVEHRTPIYPSSQSTGPSRSQHNTTASTSSNIHINAVGSWERDQCRGCLAGMPCWYALLVGVSRVNVATKLCTTAQAFACCFGAIHTIPISLHGNHRANIRGKAAQTSASRATSFSSPWRNHHGARQIPIFHAGNYSREQCRAM